MTDTASLSRRKLLQQMAAAGLVYGCGGLGMLRALAADTGADPVHKVSPAHGQHLRNALGADGEQTFLELSVALTGYRMLDRSLVPVFLENIKDAASLAVLLNKFRAFPPPRSTAQVKKILDDDKHLMAVAQVITQLWYTGAVMLTEQDHPLYPFPAYRPVSSAAYLEGRAWNAMQAHPQGRCGNGVYGYWAVAPELTDAQQSQV